MRIIFVIAFTLATGAPAAAQSLFDGNWRGDPSAAKLDPKPETYMLRDGSYTCSSCVPAWTVPADGQFHPIAGHAYVDEASITIVDPHTIVERDRKGGKLMGESTTTISPDGTTATTAFRDVSAPNGQVVTGQEIQTRIGDAPAGVHPVSGSWRNVGAQGISDNGVRFTLATQGDRFRYSDPTGTSFEGRYGGPYTPVMGDPGHTMAKIERISAMEVRETQMRDGKVTSVAEITVSPDGHRLTNVVHDMIRGTTSTLVAIKE